jgi:ketosteroid isomerase-like protein
MPAAQADAIIDVADHLFSAIENSDTAMLQEVFSEDIAVWRTGGGGDRDKIRALRVLDWFIATTTQRRYEILDRQVFDGGLVQQHVLHATGRSGGSIAMRVCMVIKIGADGLINRIDEYFDPAELAPLLT